MEYFEATSTINATPEKIWAALTNTQDLMSWPSGITSLKGKIAKGEKLELQAEAAPGRTFKLKVVRFFPNQSMTWASGMPFGLFKGQRTYSLTPDGDQTHFKMREEFTGAMLPMIWKSIPDLNPSFKQFADGLKTHVENEVENR
ncbi:SRPBCC family protein [Maritalea sp.]|uniref:SRPBCC family protein n=1 Tax=Maritalea sp. TaxID=2003361 RepID=UPI003EF8EC34